MLYVENGNLEEFIEMTVDTSVARWNDNEKKYRDDVIELIHSVLDILPKDVDFVVESVRKYNGIKATPVYTDKEGKKQKLVTNSYSIYLVEKNNGVHVLFVSLYGVLAYIPIKDMDSRWGFKQHVSYVIRLESEQLKYRLKEIMKSRTE